MNNKKEIALLYKHHKSTINHIKGDDFCKVFADEKLIHSLQVIGAGNLIFKHEKSFKNRSEDFLRCARISYSLHDIGRFAEIKNIYDGIKGTDHGIWGADILANIKEYNDPRIILSVRHHGHLYEPFENDKDYQNIKDKELKKEIEECLFLTQDADKIANLYLLTNQFERHRQVWEANKDEQYIYGPISKEYLASFERQELFDVKKRQSTSDALLIAFSWIFDINYRTSFEFIKKHNLLEGIINSLKRYNKDFALQEHLLLEANKYIDKKIDNLSKI